MAKPEQTEKPTAKKRGQARSRGQVAKSPEVATAFIFMTTIIILHLGFMASVDRLGRLMATTFVHIYSPHDVNIFSAWGYFERAFVELLPILITIFIAAIVVALAANFLQFGFLFTLHPLKPKFSKLNPIPGIKNIFFSQQTFVTLGKQIIKLCAVGFIIYLSVKDDLPSIYNVARDSPHEMLNTIEALTYRVGFRFGLFLIVIATADYAFMRYKNEQGLKMSKQEVKDEHRQQEQSGELRGAVSRRRQQARKRMMAAVPKATVVVTNPTHFAVALQWDELTMEAPVLTAKGADLIAKRIRDIAKEHNIPILENAPLARTLYSEVELDSPVPPQLYAATAQVIAFVYKLKRKSIA